MFAASKIYPWFEAPSPYIAIATFFFFEYLTANARPVPTGTCPPTIPEPP